MESIINAAIGLTGAAIGGLLSYIGCWHGAKENTKAQNAIFEKNKENAKEFKREKTKKCARLIYLDLLNALDEGYKIIKGREREFVGKAPDLLPMHEEFSAAIMNISDELTVEQIILINRIYGYMEKVRHDILALDYQTANLGMIVSDYELMEVEVFGVKYKDIIQFKLENITKDFFIDKMDIKYQELFQKLRSLGELEHYGS